MVNELGNRMWVRVLARLLLPLGVNLNWVFAPRLWWRVRRGAPVSLAERRLAVLRNRPQE